MKKTKRAQRIGRAAKLLPALLLACSANLLTAQDFVKTYHANVDMKQYSILPVADKPMYVMAGTLRNHYAHFVRTDDNGNQLNSEFYMEVAAHSEEHVVNMLQIDDDTYVITCLRRDSPLTSTSKDKVKIYIVNGGGAVVDAQVLTSSATDYKHLYPMHSVYYNGILYVCGFVSNQDIYTDPNAPYFRGANTKKAFVLRYNPVTQTVLNTQTFDNTYTFVNMPGPEVADFDVAMHMKITSNGKLYVTGGCNVIQAATTISPTYALNSGTLNLELDATTLAIQNTNTTTNVYTAFTNETVTTAYNYGEYGVDIVEDPVSSGYFVVGNTADYSKLMIGTGIDPHNMQFTYIDNNFRPQGIKSRQRIHGFEKGAWALTAMESAYGAGHMLIGGMQTEGDPNCYTTTPPPSKDNFYPCLSDVSLQWTGSPAALNGTINDWKTYVTHFTTGPSSLTNSYYQYGGSVAYNGWNPLFASRRPIGNVLGDNNVVFTAPSWNNAPQTLNLKMSRTDDYGKVPSCQDSYVDCAPGIEPMNVVHIPKVTLSSSSNISVTTTAASLTVTAAAAASVPQDFGFQEVIDCEQTGGNYYRTAPAAVATVHAAQSLGATLVPNPASDYVQISLKGSIDAAAETKIELTDITGKLIATLYNGKAAGITDQSHFTLPAVAAGMYLVKISVGNQVLPVQKLIINGSR
ncbi:T9SS type A sorting domain-containing protein [Chitinophagaceae bacterium MMS25-I14]